MRSLLATVALAVAPAAVAADLQIRFLDVGQGDAILVTTPDGKSMLYDAGQPKDRAAELARSFGVQRLDLAVASQGDADHFGGFEGVATMLKPRVFLNNGLAKTTKTYARVIAAMRTAGARGVLATERTIELGDQVSLRVLPAPANVPKNDQNANSVGILLTYGKFKAFFGGDAEPVTTAGWARKYGSVLASVDVHKALHHGSKHNDTTVFLALLKPRDVFVGVGKANRYGHPTPEALLLYRQAGAAVYRTDLNGTITVTVKPDGSYTVTAERELGRRVGRAASRTIGDPPAPARPAPAARPAAPAQSPAPSTGYSGRFDPRGPDRDCSDFRMWAEAQSFFRAAGPGDPHDLDRDNDGSPCDSLR